MTHSATLTGGGCVPRLSSRHPSDAWAKLQAEQDRKAKLKRQAWLKTPEGIEYTRKQKEQQELEAAAACKRQEEEAFRQQVTKVWWDEYNVLQSKQPTASAVLDSGHQCLTLHISKGKKDPNSVVVFAAAHIPETSPMIPPRWTISERMQGLKIFINAAGRREMEAKYPNEFASVLDGLKTVEHVPFTGSIRIIGTAATGKSLHGELVPRA